VENQGMNYHTVTTQATIFSRASFCRLWADAYGQKWNPFGPNNELGLIYSQPTRLGPKRYELSPSGLYWGCDHDNVELSRYFLEKAKQLSNQWNCISLNWNFRYDAYPALEQVIAQIGPTGFKITKSYTHVLDLNGLEFTQIEQKLIKALTRRQIRIGGNAGLLVREIKTKSDFDQHNVIHMIWAASKKIEPKPPQLIPKLATEMGPSTLFLGAFKKEKLMAAILVFRDPKEWFYWYGIRDIHDDKYYATDVLLAYAIQKASENKVRFFNMGGSNQIKSLEFFKERWGAEKRSVWTLRWENPFWSLIRKLHSM
jgi:hypothetical protein